MKLENFHTIKDSSPHLAARSLKKFKKIYIEITNRCNLACGFCLKSMRPKQCMSVATFAGILARLKDHTEHLALHVLGEPLLHPELGQLLDLCHRKGFKVNLTTNGTLLPRQQEMLLASPTLRQVNISLQSYEEQETSSALDDYLTGIFSFIQAAIGTSPLFICLRLWNLEQTIDSTARRRNNRILEALEAFFALPIPIADTLTPGQGITLAPRIFLSMAPRFTWPHNPGPELDSRGFCHGLKDHVAILVDGTVVPCCLDAEADMPLGNILSQPMDDILAGPRAQAIRQGFAQRRIVDPLCRRCSYRLNF